FTAMTPGSRSICPRDEPIRDRGVSGWALSAELLALGVNTPRDAAAGPGATEGGITLQHTPCAAAPPHREPGARAGQALQITDAPLMACRRSRVPAPAQPDPGARPGSS